MRPVTVTIEGLTAEVAGGWVVETPVEDLGIEVPIRLDDGRSAMCLPDERIGVGDRVYRATYTGRIVQGRVGIEIHDVTADLVQTSCRTLSLRTSYVYAGMAAVPAMVLAGLVAMRVLWGREGVSVEMLAATALSLAIPTMLWLFQTRATRLANERREAVMAECRAMVDEVVAHDVAHWKERLNDAIPNVGGSTQRVFIRGTACRVVEGVSSIGGEVAEIIRNGRSIGIPANAVEACGLQDGDLVHALVAAGRIPSVPLAVSNPMTGSTWTDDAIAGGRDGTVYRATMRTALGRAAWNMVTRQWDEIGRRRRTARRA